MYRDINDEYEERGSHYITSAEDQYNHLARYIVESWRSISPDGDPRYYRLTDMIDELTRKAIEGDKLLDRMAQSANDDINARFADMRGMMVALEQANR